MVVSSPEESAEIACFLSDAQVTFESEKGLKASDFRPTGSVALDLSSATGLPLGSNGNATVTSLK